MLTAELDARLKARGVLERVAMFLGKPDRWYADPHWRCANDHVSLTVLKSEAKGCACCLECFSPVVLTFPEDKDGPLC